MLAPGLSARSRALARLPCASQLSEFLTTKHTSTIPAICRSRSSYPPLSLKSRPATTAAAALSDRRSVSTNTSPNPHTKCPACGKPPLAIGSELTAALQRLHTATIERNLPVALKSYDLVRTGIAESCLCSGRSVAAGSVAGLVSLEDLREFCRLLRYSADGARWETVQKLGKVVLRVIADVYGWGIRANAPLVAECLAAHNLLRQPSRTLEVWQQTIDRAMADQCPTDNVAMKLSVDMHVSAVQAAVAMKNPKLVRSVYNQAIRYMRESPNTRPSGIASLRRFFAALVYPSVVAEELSSGTDRRWDAARLGPAFLMQTFEDAKSIMPGMEATRCLMLQYALRAMVQTGQWTRALRIYQAVQWNHAKTGPKPTTHVDVSGVILTSAITTEMVRGLGRNSQMDEARRILMDAPQNIHSVYMWNAFLNAVVDQIGAVYSPNNGSRYDLEYLDLQLHCMKKVHGIQPDHTTETIRMRALLRSGEWKRAVKCFRRIQRAAPEDIVAWDTLVRGLMMADDRAANNCGWEMVDELVQNALPDMADARMADTVLKFALPMVASSFCERNPESMARILQWAEKRMGKDRKSTYAIVVGALLRAGQVDSALEIHRTMRARGFWPSRAISCMIAEELAKKDSGRAEAFIETQVSPHYFASAYSAVLKAVLVTRDYEAAWRLMDAHYPVVQLPEDHGQMPFPDSIMYHRALQMARTHGDWEELRRVLSRMRHHLELSRDEFPQFATRIAQLLHNYKYAGTSPCGHT